MTIDLLGEQRSEKILLGRVRGRAPPLPWFEQNDRRFVSEDVVELPFLEEPHHHKRHCAAQLRQKHTCSVNPAQNNGNII